MGKIGLGHPIKNGILKLIKNNLELNLWKKLHLKRWVLV